MSEPRNFQQHLEDLLREQGEQPEDIANLVPALQHMEAWHLPRPTDAHIQRLLTHLLPALPQVSAVRRSIASRQESTWGGLLLFLDVARAQVSVLRPGFWLLSSLLTLLGLFAIFLPGVSQTLLLRTLGPGIAYLGTARIFRGTRLGLYECEVACPPSLQQLTLARLLIVLTYDTALGTVLSGIVSLSGSGTFWLLILHWLAPLLLVTGVALVLSLVCSMRLALHLAYGSWLLLVAFLFRFQVVTASFSLLAHWFALGELCMGLLGLLLLWMAFQHLPAPHLVP